jgi:hypothetical protein
VSVLTAPNLSWLTRNIVCCFLAEPHKIILGQIALLCKHAHACGASVGMLTPRLAAHWVKHVRAATDALLTVCLSLPAGPQQQPWVPLSVNLGVPLFCPNLCQLVCDNMMQQQSLTPDGEATWRSAQQQLQQQLDEHVDWAHSSSRGAGSCQQLPGGAAVGQGVHGVDKVGMNEAAGMAGGDVTLPSHYLLFDGHSLLPVDVSGCLQGVQLW